MSDGLTDGDLLFFSCNYDGYERRLVREIGGSRQRSQVMQTFVYIESDVQPIKEGQDCDDAESGHRIPPCGRIEVDRIISFIRNRGKFC